MRAMVLEKANHPLVARDLPCPVPGAGHVLLRVRTCGICRTDLHILDGELTDPKLPLVMGHQIVGEVATLGPGVTGLSVGDRVGVPWLGFSCGQCDYCRTGLENLCAQAKYTGYQIDGGFAEYCVADRRFCFPIPAGYDDLHAAPLLCAGLIGYRAYRMALESTPLSVRRLGLYGFGSAAHILCQVATQQGREVYAFVRPGDQAAADFARSLGAVWAGPSDQVAPEPLDAAILFAPVGSLVPAALCAIRPGGAVICAGIYMSIIPSFDYDILWSERAIRSVANLTRADGEEFLALAGQISLATEVCSYTLEQVNKALKDLRNGVFSGAAAIYVAGDEPADLKKNKKTPICY